MSQLLALAILEKFSEEENYELSESAGKQLPGSLKTEEIFPGFSKADVKIIILMLRSFCNKTGVFQNGR